LSQERRIVEEKGLRRCGGGGGSQEICTSRRVTKNQEVQFKRDRKGKKEKKRIGKTDGRNGEKVRRKRGKGKRKKEMEDEKKEKKRAR
jgi:hypothetical protein